MISLSGYYNETQKSADTELSDWSKLAFGLPAVFRENTILWKQKQTSGFYNLLLPQFVGINLLQIGISRFKLNAIEQLHSLAILAFHNAFCHWSSCFPFLKLKENKSREVKCSVAKLLLLFEALTLTIYSSVLRMTMKIQICFVHICLSSGWSISWISDIQSSNYYCHIMFSETFP